MKMTIDDEIKSLKMRAPEREIEHARKVLDGVAGSLVEQHLWSYVVLVRIGWTGPLLPEVRCVLNMDGTNVEDSIKIDPYKNTVEQDELAVVELIRTLLRETMRKQETDHQRLRSILDGTYVPIRPNPDAAY